MAMDEHERDGRDPRGTGRRGVILGALGGVAGAAGVLPRGAAAQGASAAARSEGVVVVATAGGFLQENLARHLYAPFTEKTGIRVQPVTINPMEQWAKVKADSLSKRVQWDLVNVGPDSMVLQREFLADLGPACEAIPNLRRNGASGVCQRYGFLYVLGGYILGVSTKAFPNGGPQNAAEFFDVRRFPGPRAMASNEPVYNMMIALAADGVQQKDLWPLDIKRALAKMDTIKPHIASWWESSDQAMRNWRSGEVVMSMFWAGRIPQMRKAGEPIVPVWAGFPRDISGFGLLKDAPHPNAAKAFLDFFFADESAQLVANFADAINYDPPHSKSLELPSTVDPKTRATYPDNWNALLSLDVEILRDQRRAIETAWQEWIAR